MNFLLDTSTFLWFVTNDNTLSAGTRTLLESPRNGIYVSVASLWEIAIKCNLGKLDIALPFSHFIDRGLAGNRLRLLDIKISHLKRIAELPLIHRDPFDRLIIVQSLEEGLPVITNDVTFDDYAVQRIW